jgi:hypothetical protein
MRGFPANSRRRHAQGLVLVGLQVKGAPLLARTLAHAASNAFWRIRRKLASDPAAQGLVVLWMWKPLHEAEPKITKSHRIPCLMITNSSGIKGAL